MRKLSYLFISSLIAICSNSASAQGVDITTGNYWLAVCTSANATDAAQCLALIIGMNLGIEAQSYVSKGPDWYCLPNSVSNQQAQDIFVSYLKANPKDRNLPAGLLFAAAMRDAFPCAQANH